MMHRGGRASRRAGRSAAAGRSVAARRSVCALVLLLGIAWPACAEQIRGIIVSEVTIPSDAAYENTVALTIEEMAVVALAQDTPFLTDIRVELRLSNALKKHFDTFALGVYKNISPTPRGDRRFFEGQRAFFQYLPYLNRIYVLIPLEGSETPQESLPVGTYRLAEAVRAEEFPLLVTLVPLGKGVPSAIAAEKFYLTLKPVLQRKGYLELELRFPTGHEGQSVRLLVDERDVPYPLPPLELPAGIHQLRVLSAGFKEVSTSFAVESGKTVRLEIPLEQLLSTLRIDAPQGAQIFLDGERIVGAPAGGYPVEPGTHLVRVKIGDYSHSKKFVVEPGKHYHLAVVFDIIVNEE